MTNVQQLRKQSPPSRTPQRQALADAIAAHTEAEQHLAAIKQALESSTSAIFAAERAVKAAESAIEEAKKNAATHLVATMLNTAGTPPITVKAARSTLLDEQDQLDAASDAKIALEREERSAESTLAIARMTLNDRVRDVLRGSPEVQALLDELAAARTAVIEISAKLATLPSDVAPNWHAEKPRVVPQTDAEWKGCIEELRSNADASLPS